MLNIKMLDIAVIILFYNKLNQTIACIESFIPSGVNIYVLDNGSDNFDLMNLKDRFRDNCNVYFFHSSQNIGVSRGRNLLIKKTTEEWLFSVDNDIVVINTQDWIENLTSHIVLNTTIDVFIPRLYNIHDQSFSNYNCLCLNGNELSEIKPTSDIINSFPGGASIINRRIFEKVGLYDENIFVGFEDLELAIRALSISKKLICKTINDIELAHHHKVAENKNDVISIKNRYSNNLIRNSFEYLQKKHGIVYDHQWDWWVRRQKSIMIQHNCENRVVRLSRRVNNFFSKLFKLDLN